MCTSRKFMIAAVLTILACLRTGGELRANASAILKEMPQNAQVVFVCHSIDNLNNKLQVLSPLIPPQESGEPFSLKKEILSGMTDMLGQEMTLKADAGFGMAMLNVMQGEQSLVVFIPVTNAEQTIQSISNKSSAGEGIWMVEEEWGKVYFKAQNEYLVMSPNSLTLNMCSQMPKGVSLNNNAMSVIKNSDVGVMVNMTPLMGMVKMWATGMLMGNEEIQKHPSFGQMISMTLDRVTELQTITLGGVISDAGITLKGYYQAMPGSVLANHLKSGSTTSLSDLSQFPQGNIVAAGAMKFDPQLTNKPIAALMDALAADSTIHDTISASDINKLKSILTRMYTLSSESSQAMYLIGGDESASGADQTEFVQIQRLKNAKQILELMNDMMPALTGILQNMGLPVELKYEENAGKVNGIGYDNYVFNMNQLMMGSMGMPNNAGSGQSGEDATVSQKVCVLNDNVMVTGLTEEALKKAMSMVNMPSPAKLSAQSDIKAVADHLSDEANVIFVMDYGKMMKANMQMAPQQQQQMAMMSMMETMFSGYMGMSCTITDGGMEADFFVPMSLIQNVGKMAPMMLGMGMGGGMPAQPSGTF